MIELFLFVFFAINTGYIVVLSVAGHFYAWKKVSPAPSFKRIAVLVPCYQEDGAIIPTVHQLYALNYPDEYYDVAVIAGSMQPQTLEALGPLGCTVLQVQFEESLKSRPLNDALQQLPAGRYDIVVIVNADNILSRNFLRDVNDLYYAGYTVLQAQRVSRNNDTPMALLDGLSEGINSHLFRQGGDVLGLSSSLSGSGMSFPFELLKASLAGMDSAGEEKGLQQVLAEHGHRIYYRKDLVVFDEKEESPEAWKKLPIRWRAWKYAMWRNDFFKGFRLLLRGNVNFFNMAVCHNFFPSRINSVVGLLVLSVLFTVLFFSQPYVVLRWWTISGLYLAALALATPRTFYSRKAMRSLLILPKVLAKPLPALVLSVIPSRRFIHTLRKRAALMLSTRAGRSRWRHSHSSPRQSTP